MTGLILVGAALLPGTALAQDEDPKYPHVNTVVDYRFDPSWPKKPQEFYWGHIPGIAIDAKDQVYVFTRSKPPVQVYDAKGKFLRAWGSETIGSAHHIRIGPDGNIWITDLDNHVVQKYTPTGKLLQTLGTRGKAGRDQTHFNMPTDVAVTPQGDIYVSDGYGNARVVHFDKSGKYLNEWGELGQGPGQFSIPHSIAADSKGRLYVADRNNVRVQVFDPKGKLRAQWKNLIVPWGIWISKKDEIWICGSSPMQWRPDDGALGCPPKDQVFMKFAPDGRLLQLFTLPKGLDGLERPGEVNWVHCLAFDSRGNLYVGDIIGRRAQKFTLVQP
jgi:sugar lactone lactonase YvrE